MPLKTSPTWLYVGIVGKVNPKICQLCDLSISQILSVQFPHKCLLGLFDKVCKILQIIENYLAIFCVHFCCLFISDYSANHSRYLIKKYNDFYSNFSVSSEIFPRMLCRIPLWGYFSDCLKCSVTIYEQNLKNREISQSSLS